MKKFTKKIFLCTAILLLLFYSLSNYNCFGKSLAGSVASFFVKADEGDNNEDSFGFIKSGKSDTMDFIYDSTALLYGGIALISISVFGIIVTLMPKKKKRQRRNKNRQNSQNIERSNKDIYSK